MEKPVQWKTLQELRDELERTRQAWETADLDGLWPPSPDNRAHLHALDNPVNEPIASAHLPT